MGRIVRLIGLFSALFIIAGCNNALQDYLATQLFGPPYHLEAGKLTVEGAVNFGHAVDIDGEYAIVGAPAEDNNTANPEAVYIYHRTSMDQWDDGVKLTAADGSAGDNFGFSVAIEGDFAVVGAPYHSVNGEEAAGAVYIYTRTGTNAWDLNAKLTQADSWATSAGFDAVEYALFGSALALKGNWLFIAADQDDLGGALNSHFGAVYAFKLAGTWNFEEQLTAGPNEQAGARFGSAIHAGGDYFAVGAAGEDIDGDNKVGAVYLFQFLVDDWETDARIVAPDGAVGDGFGLSVAVNNSHLAVSAPLKTVDGSAFSGKVYVFSNDGAGNWSSTPTELTPSESHEHDFYGFPIALTEDSSALMAGCLFRDDVVTDGGIVYLYTINTADTWSLDETLSPESPEASSYFGKSIAIGEEYAIIGATHTYEYHADGAAYLYR